jgi:hypothetical protein
VTVIAAAVTWRVGHASAQAIGGAAATPTTGEWAPARTADGQPDIQGRWDPTVSGTFDLTDPKTGGARLDELIGARAGKPRAKKPSRVVDPPDGQIPYLPWAAAHQAEIARHADEPAKPEHIDPQARCLPGGVPRELFHSETRIVQAPNQVIFLQAQNHVSRIVWLDGRRRPSDEVKLWMGASRGRWEGNTLVVDVTNQNGKGRFDMVGNFGSDRLRLRERWTIVDANTIDYSARIEDPSTYSRPWTVAARLRRERPGTDEYADEYWEDACHEGERSADDLIVPAKPEAPR